jgi:hypothetical protein
MTTLLKQIKIYIEIQFSINWIKLKKLIKKKILVNLINLSNMHREIKITQYKINPNKL